MKEAIGTSYVFGLIMTFVGILIAMYVGSIAYTKGFKVRNKIIDLIDKNNGYTDRAIEEIDVSLASIGYRIIDKECPNRTGATTLQGSDYRYCVYRYDETKGEYYGVTVFIGIDVPLIGGYIEIPVYGETRLLYDKHKICEGQPNCDGRS